MMNENISKVVLEIQCLSDHATVPIRKSDCQAGWDLFSATNINILPKTQQLISTDIAVSIPYGCYGLV